MNSLIKISLVVAAILVTRAADATSDSSKLAHEIYVSNSIGSTNIIDREHLFSVLSATPFAADRQLSAQQIGPIVVLWSFLAPQYPALDSKVVQTPSGGVSVVTLMKSAPTLPDDNLKLLWSTTAGIVSKSIPLQPETICPPTPGTAFLACCTSSPNPQCIQQLDSSYCSGALDPNACRNIVKLSGMTSILKGISQEIAGSSQLLLPSQLKANISDGQLYFVWPYVPNSPTSPLNGKWLVTNITGDLIDRLLTVARVGLSTLRKFNNQPPDIIDLQCGSTGNAFTHYDLSPENLPNVFYISLGRPTNALMPPGQATAWSVSVYVESTAADSRLTLISGINPALGSDSKWISFANLAQKDPNREFYCVPGVKLSDLYALRAQLNNSDAGLFVFGLNYLRAALADYLK